jgi:hypothetical protein
MTRVAVPGNNQDQVLLLSRRRCCICFGLHRDLDVKQGQIAHLDHDNTNYDLDNLAFLCLPHHDQYDGKTSQSKALRESEVKHFRKELYEKIAVEQPDTEAAKLEEKPPTLFDLFKSEFPVMKVSDNEPVVSIKWADGSEIKISRQVYMDFPTRTKFAGFYIPAPKPPTGGPMTAEKTVAACQKLAEVNAVQDAFDHVLKQVDVHMGEGDQMTTIRELTFSGRVLIYHEELLSIPQKAEILKAFTSKEQAVTFVGSEHLGAQVIAWHRKRDAQKS